MKLSVIILNSHWLIKLQISSFLYSFIRKWKESIELQFEITCTDAGIPNVAICFPDLESTSLPPVFADCVDLIHQRNIFFKIYKRSTVPLSLMLRKQALWRFLRDAQHTVRYDVLSINAISIWQTAIVSCTFLAPTGALGVKTLCIQAF